MARIDMELDRGDSRCTTVKRLCGMCCDDRFDWERLLPATTGSLRTLSPARLNAATWTLNRACFFKW